MPVAVVKTKHDETLWSDAKAQAQKQGQGNNYAYIMGIFKKMKGEKSMSHVAEDLMKSMTSEIETHLDGHGRYELLAVIDVTDWIEKGAGHKYIKRVPTGDPKRKYRYYYRDPVTGKVVSSDDIQAGSKFKGTHNGKMGHFEIVGHDEDENHVVVHHDESGHHMKMHVDEFHALVNKHAAKRLKAEGKSPVAPKTSGGLKYAPRKKEAPKPKVTPPVVEKPRVKIALPDKDKKKVSEKNKAKSEAKAKRQMEQREKTNQRIKERLAADEAAKNKGKPKGSWGEQQAANKRAEGLSEVNRKRQADEDARGRQAAADRRGTGLSHLAEQNRKQAEAAKKEVEAKQARGRGEAGGKRAEGMSKVYEENKAREAAAKKAKSDADAKAKMEAEGKAAKKQFVTKKEKSLGAHAKIVNDVISVSNSLRSNEWNLPASELKHLKEKFNALKNLYKQGIKNNDNESLAMAGEYYTEYMKDLKAAMPEGKSGFVDKKLKEVEDAGKAPEPVKEEKKTAEVDRMKQLDSMADAHENLIDIHSEMRRGFRDTSDAYVAHKVAELGHKHAIDFIRKHQNGELSEGKLNNRLSNTMKRSQDALDAHESDFKKRFPKNDIAQSGSKRLKDHMDAYQNKFLGGKSETATKGDPANTAEPAVESSPKFTEKQLSTLHDQHTRAIDDHLRSIRYGQTGGVYRALKDANRKAIDDHKHALEQIFHHEKGEVSVQDLDKASKKAFESSAAAIDEHHNTLGKHTGGYDSVKGTLSLRRQFKEDYEPKPTKDNETSVKKSMGQIRPLGPNCIPVSVGGIDDYIEKSLRSGRLGLDLDSSVHAPRFEPGLVKSHGLPCMPNGIDETTVLRRFAALTNADYDPAGANGNGGQWDFGNPEDKAPHSPMLVFVGPADVEIEDDGYNTRVLNLGIPLR